MEGYSDRSMNSSRSSGKTQDGYPTGGTCPKCGAPLYYASRLQCHDRDLTEVDYCSGGCGHSQPTLQEERKKLDEAVKATTKDLAAAEPGKN